MAKKRLNTPLLTGLVVGVIVLISAGALGYWWTQSVDVPKEMAAGDAAFEAGEYEDALDHYNRIAKKIKTDPELIVKVADTRNYIAGRDQDPEDHDMARGYYYHALEVDSNYIPAHERVIEDMTQWIEGGMRQQVVLERAINDADNMLRVVPDSVEAKWLYILVAVDQYLATPNDHDPKELEKARQFIQELIADDYATDGRAVEFAVRLAAADALKERQLRPESMTEALEQINNLVSSLEEAAGDNPMRWYYAATSSAVAVQVANAISDEQAVNQWRERSSADISKAADLASAAQDDEALLTVVPAFNRLNTTQDWQRSEELLRQLVDLRSWDRMPRQLLAEFLEERQRIEQAIEVLEGDITDGPIQPGREGLRLRYVEAQNTRMRALYRLELVKKLPSATERASTIAEAETLIKEYEAQLRRLIDLPLEDTPDVLQLRGMLQIAKGDIAQGIATIKRAEAIIPSDDRNRVRKLKLWYELAQANLRLQQTGPARQYLEQILQFSPGFTPARLMLANLHINERRFAAAQEQVNFLLERSPDSVELQQLAVLAMGDQADAGYSQLPENDFASLARKHSIARSLGKADEVKRLVDAMFKLEPKRLGVAIFKSAYLAEDGDKEQAVAVLNAALDDPSDSGNVDTLRTQAEDLLKRITSESAQAYYDETRSDYQKQLDAFRGAYVRQDFEGADLALEEAEKLAPEGDDTVARLKFQRLLEKREYDQAETYLNRLADSANDGLDGASYRIEWLMGQASDPSATEEQRQASRQRAITEARELQRNLPESANAALVLGKVLEVAGDIPGALTSYDRVRELQPRNAEALDGLIRINLNLGNSRQARFYIDEARRLAPSNNTFIERELQWELQYGDPAITVAARRKALDDLQAAAKRNGTEPRPMELAAQRHELARVLRVQGERLIQDRGESGKRAASQSFTEAIRLLESIMTGTPDYRLIDRVLSMTVDTYRATDNLEGGLNAIEVASQIEVFKDTPFLVAQRAELLFDLGNEQNQGKQRAVDYLLEEIKKLEGGNDDVRLGMRRLLSDYLTQMGDHDRALAALDVSDPGLQEYRLEKMANLGRLDEAAQTVTKLLESDPDNLDVLTLAAFTDLKRRDFDSAKTYIDRALQVAGSNDVAVRFVRGIWNLSKAQPDNAAAVSDLRYVVDASPSNLQARSYLARALQNNNAHGDAINVLTLALQQAPRNVGLRLQLAGVHQTSNPPRLDLAANVLADGRREPGLENDAILLHDEGVLRKALGDKSKAQQLLKQAVTASNNNPQYQLDYLQTLLDNGQARLVISESAQVARGPMTDTWWLRPIRAKAFWTLNQKAEAQQELTAAFNAVADLNMNAGGTLVTEASNIVGPEFALKLIGDRAQSNPRWKLLAAIQTARAGAVEEAITELEAVLEQMDPADPARREAISRLGSALLEVEPARPQDAKPYLEQVVNLQPNNIGALNNLAYCLTLIGGDENIDRAVELSQRAVAAVDRTNGGIDARSAAYVYDTHGWALVQDGKIDEGIAVLQKAIGLNEFVQGYFHLASAYRQKGDTVRMRDVAILGAALLDKPLQEGENVTDETRRALIEWSTNQPPTP